MTTFQSADVLTLLVHLGYLGYDFISRGGVYSNSEISSEFFNAVESNGWDMVGEIPRTIKRFWRPHGIWTVETVALGLSRVHMETSILAYIDENALSCVISFAYYSAGIPYRKYP